MRRSASYRLTPASTQSDARLRSVGDTTFAGMTLTEYVELRLGASPGEQGRNFLARPFGAESFAAFWRYWNPVWGYFLLFRCYRPLRALVPRPAAVWLTFVLCGLVHDVPFIVGAALTGGRARFTITTFFAVVGALVVATERVHLRLTALPIPARWLVHALALTLGYLSALTLTRFDP